MTNNSKMEEKTKTKKSFISLPLILVIIFIVVVSGISIYLSIKSKMERQKQPVFPAATSTIFDSSKLQLYTDIGEEFSILIPKGWQIESNEPLGVLASFINNQIDKEGEIPFQARIIVGYKSVPADVDLQELVKKQKETFLSTTQNPKIVDERDTGVGGLPAKIVESSFTKEGGEWKTLTLFVVKNGKAYIIVATASNSTWSKYKDLFESCLQSFRLK